MQSAECKMQNEGSGLRDCRDGTLPSAASGPVGAHSGRPQNAEATPLCHSMPCPERSRRDSEESASPVQSLPPGGKVPPKEADEGSLRQATAPEELPRTTVSTSSVSGLAGDARCHLPLEGKALDRAGGQEPAGTAAEASGDASLRTLSADTTSLITRSQAGDRAATERLLEENVGLIRAVARRYWGRGVEAEDLLQLGSIGFLKAVEGFDPAFGTQFSTYAVPKIAGEIRRFLRDDGAVKVSRTLKERALAIHLARDRLSKSLGREPVLSELAEALDLTVEEIAEAESAADPVASIQQPAGDSGLTLEATLSDTPMEDRVLERLDLRQALDRLPERDARVVALRYFHGLTQDRTAKIIGVSQVQVSRIEKRALNSLRSMLEA